MSTSKSETQPAARDLKFSDTELTVYLRDGRVISVPLSWFARLSNATREQLEDYQILGDGEGLHWPQLDEDLSIKGLLAGIR